MTNIILFHFESHEIRFVGTAENPWWVAADICEVLDIVNTSDALTTLKPSEKGIANVDDGTLTGSQMLTVNEPGLYRLIFKSRKAAAERMKDWVFSVVIPSIRKTSSYSLAPEIPVPKPLLIEQSEKVAQSIERIQSVANQINLPRIKMTTSIVQFQFGFSDIRVVLIGGEPWLVAKDVCEVLGLDNVSRACERLDEDEKGMSTNHTLGGEQDMIVISESGFYRLVMTSRKPEVRKFQKWVTSVVIPSIRKTGSYSNVQEIPVPKPLVIEQSKVVAQNIVDIQQLLSGSNPRLAQLLIDIGVNDFAESHQPKLTASHEFPEDKWYGLVQLANKMGIATNESTRVKLGQYFSNAIKRGDIDVERIREERLCNGQQQEIWCYRDNDVVRGVIEAWVKQLVV